ncbi:circadian clock KaiB family protein [Mucilaginibacter sp.]|uniref:circadian clock KaiB family protein n=1 Tax=Mucilaginibacter sp. TaxID=1882438 RepID=UPI00343777B0
MFLYIAGTIQKFNKAIEKLKNYCEDELKNQYAVEIIDLLEHPHKANKLLRCPPN